MERWPPEKGRVLAAMDLSRHRASHDAWVIQETYWRTRELPGTGRLDALTQDLTPRTS